MEWPLNTLRCWKIPRKIQKVYEFPRERAEKMFLIRRGDTLTRVLGPRVLDFVGTVFIDA